MIIIVLMWIGWGLIVWAFWLTSARRDERSGHVVLSRRVASAATVLMAEPVSSSRCSHSRRVAVQLYDRFYCDPHIGDIVGWICVGCYASEVTMSDNAWLGTSTVVATDVLSGRVLEQR